MARRPVVAVLSGRNDLDGHVIAAINALGMDCVWTCLQDMAINLESASTVVVPGMNGALPDYALVLKLGMTSTNQLTHRLGLLQLLASLSVRTMNWADAIELCGNKGRTSAMLDLGNVPTPKVWVTEDRELASDIVNLETAAGTKLVQKLISGSHGSGIELVEAGTELREVTYLQRFLPEAYSGDIRVLVAGGKAIAAMKRNGEGWVNSATRGAKLEAYPVDSDEGELAVFAADVLALDIAGVDICGGMVLEVNSVPGWDGLQSVTNESIPAMIVKALATDGVLV